MFNTFYSGISAKAQDLFHQMDVRKEKKEGNKKDYENGKKKKIKNKMQMGIIRMHVCTD